MIEFSDIIYCEETKLFYKQFKISTDCEEEAFFGTICSDGTLEVESTPDFRTMYYQFDYEDLCLIMNEIHRLKAKHNGSNN